MIYLAYCSIASSEMESGELTEVLRTSRQNDERDAVTGMLLYHRGRFVQVLEGDAQKVDRTYRNIVADSRHKCILLLTRDAIKQRSFDRWSMGFLDAQNLKAADQSAYTDFFEHDIESSGLTGGKALRLLASFRDVMLRPPR